MIQNRKSLYCMAFIALMLGVVAVKAQEGALRVAKLQETKVLSSQPDYCEFLQGMSGR